MRIQTNPDQTESNLVQSCQIQIKSCQIQSNPTTPKSKSSQTQSNPDKELDLGLTRVGFGAFLVDFVVHFISSPLLHVLFLSFPKDVLDLVRVHS